MAKKINYYARSYADVRTELVNFVRQYYPDIFNDFNDASVGMMLLELNAAVGDMLSFHTDKMFNETQIDYAQERKSILSMARTFGLKVPGKRPSVTIVDFSIIAPVNGDTWDVSYAPVIRRGAQVTGGGKVFETLDDIDFSSPFTVGGIPNVTVIPQIDSNSNIINYLITKREMVINGSTKVFKRIINENDVRPFLEVVLPDNDVLSIESIITLECTNITKEPSIDQFLDEEKRWFEVDALADDIVFIEDFNLISDKEGVKPGKYIRVDQRFIREYTDIGFTKLIFGGGSQDLGSLCDFDVDKSLINRIGDFVNNLSLGITPSANKTMFVKYRVGGGSDSNLGPNTLTGLGIMDMNVSGSDNAINTAVIASLKTNNPIAALGGKNEPSVEELRNLVRYNFSAQNRAITIPDYIAAIGKMPGEFGVPFRCGVMEEQNKMKIYLLSLDSSGKLTNEATSTLKENIATYLADYRGMNDYVEVDNGKVINIGFEFDLFIDKQFPQSQIISEVISKTEEYMNINNHEMGSNIYLAQLLETVNNVAGVLNVIDMRSYNKIGGGKYSLNEISQPYLDEDTRQIDTSGEFTLFGDPISMFEIKLPEIDIKVRVK